MALRSLPAFNVASNICSRHASRLPWSPWVGIFQPTSLWLKVPFFGSDTKRTVWECKKSRIIQNSVRRVVLPPFWVWKWRKRWAFEGMIQESKKMYKVESKSMFIVKYTHTQFWLASPILQIITMHRSVCRVVENSLLQFLMLLCK